MCTHARTQNVHAHTHAPTHGRTPTSLLCVRCGQARAMAAKHMEAAAEELEAAKNAGARRAAAAPHRVTLHCTVLHCIVPCCNVQGRAVLRHRVPCRGTAVTESAFAL